MPNCVFQFKQFSVWSHLGGFKVGTDAVLLGAWTEINAEQQMLDIGTGSGIISLMLAQRTKANILAIDIDGNAANQAAWNFQRAPFGKLKVEQTSLQAFAMCVNRKFDHIVCNPPFFQFSSKPKTETLKRAKHTVNLSPQELFELSADLLTMAGKMTIIYPYRDKESWEDAANRSGLYPYRILNVKPFSESEIKRKLVEFRKEKITAPTCSNLVLEQGESNARKYTKDFQKLMADYYIRF